MEEVDSVETLPAICPWCPGVVDKSRPIKSRICPLHAAELLEQLGGKQCASCGAIYDPTQPHSCLLGE
jgi:hypothetical protein